MNKYSLATNFNTIYLHEDVLQTIQQHAQRAGDQLEAGGILAGKIYTDKSWEIISASTPQKHDRRSRYRFYRSKDHQLILKKLWKDSNETISLLGTWHTHPEDYPKPSHTDINDWGAILKWCNYHGDHLVFAIVGIKLIRFWLGNKPNKFTFLGEINAHTY